MLEFVIVWALCTSYPIMDSNCRYIVTRDHNFENKQQCEIFAKNKARFALVEMGIPVYGWKCLIEGQGA